MNTTTTGHTDKNGTLIKKHDKLLCGNGLDMWFTHVQYDAETNRWHRECDYSLGIVVGRYES